MVAAGVAFMLIFEGIFEEMLQGMIAAQLIIFVIVLVFFVVMLFVIEVVIVIRGLISIFVPDAFAENFLEIENPIFSLLISAYFMELLACRAKCPTFLRQECPTLTAFLVYRLQHQPFHPDIYTSRFHAIDY